MWKLHPEIAARQLEDGTTLLFNPDNGEVFAVNLTGGILYQALLHGADSEEALLATLQEACSGVPDDAVTEVRGFISEMIRRGLLSQLP